MGGSDEPDGGSNDLFFQLSGADRRRILIELEMEELKLNELAKKLGMTATETLRQLQRLCEASLLDKLVDGKYRVTTYGKLVLESSSLFDFISKYKDFFQNHDVFLIPYEFRARLSELSKCNLATSTIETMNEVAEMFKGAERKIDATVLGFELLLDISRQRLKEGVKVRWLMDESFLKRASVMLGIADQLPEMRSTPRIIGNVNVTDKLAMLTLRQNDGKMSYYSFYGGDPSFLKWAEDLFAHEWDAAKPWFPYMEIPIKET